MSFELILNNADVNLPQSIANLAQLKEELMPRLKKYNELVVTEDSIKAAKEDKAALNKLKQAIEEQRISIKKQYLEPYNVLESQCKEVVALIDAPIQAIDKQIKAFDEIEIKQKYEALEQAFAELEAPEWVIIDDILNPKWKNKTAKLESLKAEMADKMKKITEDVTKLGDMYGDKSYYLPILNKYKTTKDFSQTAVYAAQLETEYRKEQERKSRESEVKAKRESELATQSVQDAPEPPETVSNDIIPSEPQTVVNEPSAQPEAATAPTERIITGRFEVTGTVEQIKALGAYMKYQGIQFKTIK